MTPESLVDSVGGTTGAQPSPPTESNSFIFTYVFAEKHPHQRLVPPMAWHSPQWEILDLQLRVVLIQTLFYFSLLTSIL